MKLMTCWDLSVVLDDDEVDGIEEDSSSFTWSSFCL